MLSREDQRRLAEIEERLEADDPRLAEFMRHPKSSASRWALLMCTLAWMVVIGLAIAGLWIMAIVMTGPLISATLLAAASYRETRQLPSP